MTHSIKRPLQVVLSIVIGMCCLFLSENVSLTISNSVVTQAEARVGRPATPVSYAGVARRTTRRAVVVGGAAAAGAYGAGCVQVADAYGQIVTQCP
jgi:hypothetical protein